MNLSDFILSELGRQRMSYDRLAERAYSRNQGITASYLCILVNRPLKGLRENTIRGVAAALAPSDDEVREYEERVAACCLESWGYSAQRIADAHSPDHAAATATDQADQPAAVATATDQADQPAAPSGNWLIIATNGLTAEQALDVQRVAAEHIARMEATSNGAGGHSTDKGTRTSPLRNAVPHPRPQPHDNHGGRHARRSGDKARRVDGTGRASSASRRRTG